MNPVQVQDLFSIGRVFDSGEPPLELSKSKSDESENNLKELVHLQYMHATMLHVHACITALYL